MPEKAKSGKSNPGKDRRERGTLKSQQEGVSNRTLLKNIGKKQRANRRKQPDFATVLALPAPLVSLLQEWWHVAPTDWDACMTQLREPGKAYREWGKSKGPGKGKRHYAAPCEELKYLQRKILERFLNEVVVHSCRYETRGSSFLENAAQHMGARYVYSVDIVSAFPYTHRECVRTSLTGPFVHHLEKLFGKNYLTPQQMDKLLEATVDLLCYKDKLPQGANPSSRLPQGPPTSPRIFGIVCLNMDADIRRACSAPLGETQKYKLTAYVDGYYMSSAQPIPEKLMDKVQQIIRQYGFLPHVKGDKNCYYSPGTGKRPIITGLVVTADGRLTIEPRSLNRIRGRIYRLNHKPVWDKHDIDVFRGFIGFMKQIEEINGTAYLPAKLKNLLPTGHSRLAASSS